jgi:hypothetical protein
MGRGVLGLVLVDDGLEATRVGRYIGDPSVESPGWVGSRERLARWSIRPARQLGWCSSGPPR